jgi:transcriptional regulator with XRE-family HTH domain
VPGTTRNAIGPRIRELRHEQGLTLDDLATRVGISASHLSRLERGKTAPSFTVAAGLAHELGVTAEEFVQIERRQSDVDHQLVMALCQAGLTGETAAHIRDGISTQARAELLAALQRRN